MEAQLIEFFGDPKLVLDGKGDFLRLGAVAEGRVIKGDGGFHFLSKPTASWRVRTPSSVYFSSITREILISEVEIIWMFTPSLANTEKVLAAIPAWERMPTPMMETFAIFSSESIFFAPISLATPSMIFRAFFRSALGTVKVRSVAPSSLTFWTIISTLILASAMGLNSFIAMPGLSGT